MTPVAICNDIYNFVLPISEKITAPLAYINIEIGFSFPEENDALWKAFNDRIWDTPLSSAELFISRRPFDGSNDTSVTVVSLTTFESEDKIPLIPVENGFIR